MDPVRPVRSKSKNDHLGTRKRLRMSSLKSCGESAGISRDRFNNGRSKMWSVLRPAFRVFPPWSGKLSAADGRTLSWRWLTSARFKPPPQLCGKWNGKFSTAFEHNPSTCRPLWLDWGLLACFESFGISQLPADHPFCAGMGCRLRAFSHLMLQSPLKQSPDSPSHWARWNSWRKWDRLDSFVIISTLFHVVKFAWLATQICSNGLYFNVAGQAFEVACVTQCLAKMQLVDGTAERRRGCKVPVICHGKDMSGMAGKDRPCVSKVWLVWFMRSDVLTMVCRASSCLRVHGERGDVGMAPFTFRKYRPYRSVGSCRCQVLVGPAYSNHWVTPKKDAEKSFNCHDYFSRTLLLSSWDDQAMFDSGWEYMISSSTPASNLLIHLAA